MTSETLGRVLISGGSGLVGQSLTSALLEKGYSVGWLSRSNRKVDKVKVFTWNVEKGEIDREAIEWADTVIHLAGAGIADKRWTKSRRKIIMDSRVQSTDLLYDSIKKGANKPKAFIAATAIGIYGADTGTHELTEDSPRGNDFLSEVVYQWEKSVDQISELGIRTVKNRLGIVLSTKGGALVPIMNTVKFGLGAPLGSGKQFMSWIHINDVVNWFINCLVNNDKEGVYNVVSESPVTNKEFTKALARVMKKPLLPPVPGFVLKMMLGEMSVIVLGGNYVIPMRISENAYQFLYSNLEEALRDLIKG